MNETLQLPDFWTDSKYARKNYLSETVTDELVVKVENQLGYSLPDSYVNLMKYRNGGIPVNQLFPSPAPTSWADDHIAISGILGIGYKLPYSLCGSLGSQFMISEWGYPEIGVYFADCPSAGHDMICMDYSNIGQNGEPRIVHVDQEADYRITHLAANFREFVLGLQPSEDPEPEDDFDEQTLWNPETISALIVPVPEIIGDGLWLELNQTLRDGQSGWTQNRVSIPRHWSDARVAITSSGLTIDYKEFRYTVSAIDLGKLQLTMLNESGLSDDDLVKIWNNFINVS